MLNSRFLTWKTNYFLCIFYVYLIIIKVGKLATGIAETEFGLTSGGLLDNENL